ncbi:hypothetical protein BGZ58_011092 [Dissophora ornata]|nr:hypothetical protein BGZ58_011092 [Dissophora ornata]
MLPSQLRKRHESMKLMARTQSQQGQQQAEVFEPSCTPSLGSSGNGSFVKDAAASTIQLDNPDNDDDDMASINASYHSGAMIRAKSYSMFESSNNSNSNSSSPLQRPSQHMQFTQGLLPSSFTSSSSSAIGRPEMPTRDWVKMQSKMQALESEVSHVKRTNMLLNQELDKVNAHLSRLTSEDENGSGDGGVGWRMEYEFLVQQVDWMHRQLHLAHAENARIQAHAQGTRDVAKLGFGAPQYHTEMTRELCAEVKGLTASLRMWQSAFQQAEELYRRKCDGERVLKQTLREREAQLSSLVDKVTGYESEFQKSISDYEELMRLSAEMELPEGTNNSDNTNINANTSTNAETRSDNKTHSSLEDSPASSNLNNGVILEKRGGMPGTFPGLQQQWRRGSVDGEIDTAAPPATLTVDQLSVSILSWAALLATYMLS